VDIPSRHEGSFDIRLRLRARPFGTLVSGLSACSTDVVGTVVLLQVPELVPVLIPALMSPTRILRWWLAVRAPGLSLQKESELNTSKMLSIVPTAQSSQPIPLRERRPMVPEGYQRENYVGSLTLGGFRIVQGASWPCQVETSSHGPSVSHDCVIPAKTSGVLACQGPNM